MNHGALKFLGLLALLVMIACFGALFFYEDGHGGHGWAPPKQLRWAYDGFQGTVDRQAAQRGLQVYREVCASCHSLKRVAFRSLADLGFTEGEIKALAKEYTYSKINDDGETADRPGEPSDHFPLVYPNDQAGRAANNGALPPDLSLIVKARMDGGDYIYSLLTGYAEAPPDVEISEGTHYNPYFSLTQGTAMPPPLVADGQVSYQDGTPATVDQMARDVTAFLQWAAEPEMEARKRLGIKAMLFLAVMTGFFWLAKGRVWKGAK